MKISKQILAVLDAAEGGSVELPLAEALYPRASVTAMAAAFADHCAVELEGDGPDRRLRIRVLPAQRQHAARLIGECLNVLLVHAARQHQMSGENPA